MSQVLAEFSKRWRKRRSSHKHSFRKWHVCLSDFFFFFLRILLNLHSTPSVKDKYNVRILSNTTQQVLFFSHSKSNTNYGRHTHTEQRHSGCAVWKHIYLELLHDGHIWGPWRIGKEKRKKINKNRPTNEIKGWRHPHETLTVIHTHKHREGVREREREATSNY